MQKRSQLSDREIWILQTYAFCIAVTLLIVGILWLVQRGLPPKDPVENIAEIAVLAPLNGSQANLGRAVVDVVKNSIANPPEGLSWEAITFQVTVYDTRNDLNQVARAARTAARNPNTVAIIGPLDADQLLAASQSVQGEKLPILTPASTAPTFLLKSHPGTFRIPAPDNLQGAAIVWFLVDELDLRDVFLIVESSNYSQYILNYFTQFAQNQIFILGSLEIGQAGLPADILQQIVDSQAKAVVYIGTQTIARNIIAKMNEAKMNLPFIASDVLNDPAFLPLPGNEVPVYYTSPIYSFAPIEAEAEPDAYREALGNLTNLPFALETTQATWAVLSALARPGAGANPRLAVWQNLARQRIPEVSNPNAVVGFSSGQLNPAIFIYQVNPEGGDWSQNLLVYTLGRR